MLFYIHIGSRHSHRGTKTLNQPVTKTLSQPSPLTRNSPNLLVPQDYARQELQTPDANPYRTRIHSGASQSSFDRLNNQSSHHTTDSYDSDSKHQNRKAPYISQHGLSMLSEVNSHSTQDLLSLDRNNDQSLVSSGLYRSESRDSVSSNNFGGHLGNTMPPAPSGGHIGKRLPHTPSGGSRNSLSTSSISASSSSAQDSNRSMNGSNPVGEKSPKIVHYHLTVQNCDGLELHVDQPNQKLRQKTVYSAEGRRLKRLSWIESGSNPIDISPPGGSRIALPASDIGSISETPAGAGEDTVGAIEGSSCRNIPDEETIFLSKEAEEMFSGHNQVILGLQEDNNAANLELSQNLSSSQNINPNLSASAYSLYSNPPNGSLKQTTESISSNQPPRISFIPSDIHASSTERGGLI